jgi:hypothetical protein
MPPKTAVPPVTFCDFAKQSDAVFPNVATYKLKLLVNGPSHLIGINLLHERYNMLRNQQVIWGKA